LILIFGSVKLDAAQHERGEYTMRASIFLSAALIPLTGLATEAFAESSPAPVLLAQANRPRRGKNQNPLKMRLGDIGKVHKERIAFAEGEFKIWQEFWKDVRDERGKFEVSLDKQRSAFVDSLKSLAPEFHYGALLKFEEMQANGCEAFELEKYPQMDQDPCV